MNSSILHTAVAAPISGQQPTPDQHQQQMAASGPVVASQTDPSLVQQSTQQQQQQQVPSQSAIGSSTQNLLKQSNQQNQQQGSQQSSLPPPPSATVPVTASTTVTATTTSTPAAPQQQQPVQSPQNQQTSQNSHGDASNVQSFAWPTSVPHSSTSSSGNVHHLSLVQPVQSSTSSGILNPLPVDQETRKWTDQEMLRLLKSYYLAMTQPPPQGAVWDESVVGHLVKYDNRELLFDQVCRYYCAEISPAVTIPPGASADDPITIALLDPAAQAAMAELANQADIRRRTPKSLLEKFKFLRMSYFVILDYDKKYSHLHTPSRIPNYELGFAQSGSAWYKLGLKEQRDLLGKARTPMSIRVFAVMHAIMTRLESLRTGIQAEESHSTPSAPAQIPRTHLLPQASPTRSATDRRKRSRLSSSSVTPLSSVSAPSPIPMVPTSTFQSLTQSMSQPISQSTSIHQTPQTPQISQQHLHHQQQQSNAQLAAAVAAVASSAASSLLPDLSSLPQALSQLPSANPQPTPPHSQTFLDPSQPTPQQQHQHQAPQPQQQTIVDALERNSNSMKAISDSSALMLQKLDIIASVLLEIKDAYLRSLAM
ncbi:uncharacterized protein V1516DRAFT_676133 [Lipomyces oligophaga]|uniref:uncharacterized protein n=1 Tax=Lipomyces oligophaga TaxID=45792 RepID=UPI0034CD2EB8